jgi:RNA recognition motif-containing protein
MRPHDSKGSGRRSGRGPRRSSRSRNDARSTQPTHTTKPTFWQKLISFFKGKPTTSNGQRPASESNGRREPRQSHKPESVEVTTPKLYVGNLSYDATESDLFELFKGVGLVKNAEIVSHKHNEKSKGFGFVTMASTDEAKRAVVELHDKEFMGRKLVVSGAKTSERETNYRG